VIEAVARAEADRARSPGRSKVHLIAATSLGAQGAVTMVQSDENGAALAVFGLVANARGIARAVFGDDSTRADARGSGATRDVGDTLLLEVRPIGSAPIYGVLGDDHPFRATVSPAAGPLQGLAITAALTRRQAVHSLAISPRELWHVGMLTFATILVIAFAIGSSRRELLLARARSDFIAGVSHDLRMPLAQILIASETLTLRRERDEKERLTLSSSIVREARRLISIVDNVLLFSRSGAVALRPRLQPLRVSVLFDDVIDAVKLAVDDAGQTIETPEPSPLAILGDRQLVRQALVNLVDNALKYGCPGQRIQLGAERHGRFVRLYVADEGPGVPQSERARIFEPYERLARDQASERTGTGLGLAVVRHIAQVCGGRVWLDESPARGTRVVLELPIAELPEPIVPERELV
jgi:signal transduction histidine kinase